MGVSKSTRRNTRSWSCKGSWKNTQGSCTWTGFAVRTVLFSGHNQNESSDGRTDIIEPDINVGEREMDWITSIFPDGHGRTHTWVSNSNHIVDKLMVVGKPLKAGGIENYSKMASQGIFFALDYFINNEAVLQSINMSQPGLQDKTFIIQVKPSYNGTTNWRHFFRVWVL